MRPALALGALALVGCFRVGSVRNDSKVLLPSSLENKALGDKELADLEAGNRVSFPTMFSANDGKVIATVSYVTLPDDASCYASTLDHPESIHEWLPFNHSAKVVEERGDACVVEIAQGFEEPLQAKFSVVAQREGRVMRWELDAGRPHDIRDTWGYVALRPYANGTLMIVAVALDLGDGIIRDILEAEVHEMMGWAVEDARRYYIGQGMRSCIPNGALPHPAGDG